MGDEEALFSVLIPSSKREITDLYTKTKEKTNETR